MITNCSICGCEIELDVDEFLEIEQEPDDYYCDDCAAEIREKGVRLFKFYAN
jgi:hypothetical protein